LFARSDVLQRFDSLHKRFVMCDIQQDRRRLSVMRYYDGTFGFADLADTGCYSGSKFRERLYVFGEL
jgi:hypothetical protein